MRDSAMPRGQTLFCLREACRELHHQRYERKDFDQPEDVVVFCRAYFVAFVFGDSLSSASSRAMRSSCVALRSCCAASCFFSASFSLLSICTAINVMPARSPLLIVVSVPNVPTVS